MNQVKNSGGSPHSRLLKYGGVEQDLEYLKQEKMNIKLKLQHSFGPQQQSRLANAKNDLIRVEDLDPTPSTLRRNNIRILKTPADIINEQVNK